MRESPSPTANKKMTITGGKLLLIVGAMWVAALIGVYVVVVQLKLGGEKGIRLPGSDDGSQVDGGVGGG